MGLCSFPSFPLPTFQNPFLFPAIDREGQLPFSSCPAQFAKQWLANPSLYRAGFALGYSFAEDILTLQLTSKDTCECLPKEL